MDRVLTITFESSITDLCEVNSSFDAGVLRIAYAGENRNGSYISKEAFESAIPTIYNVPVVTHYIREEDSLGGHDMELVRDADGNLDLINLTTPVGVVPESAKYWWDTVEEEDGTEHDYLYTEVLLWKRQEAYKKIKEDGVVSHSMEITVKDGERKDGIYYINDFEFTAFALIGVEPCFESSSLEMFSAREFKAMMSDMMDDLRQTFTSVTPVTAHAAADDDIHPQKDQTEGGRTELEDNNEKMEVTVEESDAEVVEPEVETPEEEVAEEPAAEEPEAEEPIAEEPATEDSAAENPETEESGESAEGDAEPEFELACNIVDALRRALDSVKVHDEYGEWNKYWFVDFDPDKSEVYAEDTENWRLYGMSYTMDGDNAVIDFENRALKKWAIVDFIGEDDSDPLSSVFEAISKQVAEGRAAKSELCSLQEETEALRNYRDRVETEAKDQAKADLFAQFVDLEGNEMFEALKVDESDTDISVLEEKCYALRGRMNSPAKFAREVKTPRIKVDDERVDKSKDEPYGDLFAKYGDK